MKPEKTRASGRARKKAEPMTFSIFSRNADGTKPRTDCDFYSLITPDVFQELGEVDDSWYDVLRETSTYGNNVNNETNRSTKEENVPHEFKAPVQSKSPKKNADSSILQDANGDGGDISKCEPRVTVGTFSCHSTPKSGQPFVFGFSPQTPVCTYGTKKALEPNTPDRIAISLGATLGDHELSWSSSMATPSSKDIDSGQGSPVQEESMNDVAILPKVLFRQGSECNQSTFNCGEDITTTELNSSVNHTETGGESLNNFSDVNTLVFSTDEETAKRRSDSAAQIEDWEKCDVQVDQNLDDNSIIFEIVSDGQKALVNSNNSQFNDENCKSVNEIEAAPPLISDTVTEDTPSVERASQKVDIEQVASDDLVKESNDVDVDDLFKEDLTPAIDLLHCDQKLLSGDEKSPSKIPQDDCTQLHCKICCSQGIPKIDPQDLNDMQSSGGFFVLLNDVPPGMYRIVCNGDVKLAATRELQPSQNDCTANENNQNEELAEGENEGCCDNEVRTFAMDDVGTDFTKDKNSVAKDIVVNGQDALNDNLCFKEAEFKGFSTAAGKAVKVSTASLNSARRLFQDDLKFLDDGAFEADASEISEIGNCHKGGIVKRVTDFRGFSTCNGKPISVSEEALKTAKRLWNDVVETDELEEPKKVQSNEEASKTPNIENRSLSSVESVSCVNKCLKEPNPACSTLEKVPLPSNFIGFSTGAGKSITVSEESLEKAKKLFASTEVSKDVNDSAPSVSCVPSFAGFATASGKNIVVSEKALMKAKETLLSAADIVPFPSRTESVSSDETDQRDHPETSTVSERFDLKNEVPKKRNSDSCDLRTPEHKIPVSRKRLRSWKDGESGFSETGVNDEISKEDWEIVVAEFFDDETEFTVPTQHERGLISSPTRDDKICPLDQSKNSQLSTEIQLSTAALLADETDIGDDEGCWLTQNSENPKSKRKETDLSFTPRRSKRLRGRCHFGAVVQLKSEAIRLRNERLAQKAMETVAPVMGQLWQLRHESNEARVGLKQFVKRAPLLSNSLQLMQSGLMPSLLSINCFNAENYCFLWEETKDFYPTADDGILTLDCGSVLIFNDVNRAGSNEFYNCLIDMAGVDPKLISRQWFANHYRWIIWKLASLEMRFPDRFGRKILNPTSVMSQLHYRYNCEIDHSKRSTVRKLIERDDTPSKTMILCVSNIYKDTTNAENNSGLYMLDLTDGWYKIRAITDERLSKLIYSKKIFIGLKMVIFGCEFSSMFDACDPLEVPSHVFLRLNANCCRKARWDARLGFYYATRLSLPISCLYADGGRVACVEILVARLYPMQYLEKKEDGSFFVYSDRTNDRAARIFEANRNSLMEDLTTRVVSDFEELEDKKKRRMTRRSLSHGNLSRERIESLNSIEEISEILETSADPSMIESFLSEDQKVQLVDYKRSLEDKKRYFVEREIANQAKAVKERNVTPFLKFVAVDISRANQESKTCTITVWKPTPDLESYLKEGKKLRVFNLCADSRRDVGELSLKTTNQTRFVEMKEAENVSRNSFVSRQLVPLNCICGNFQPAYGVVDIVGVVVKSRLQEQGRFDCVYVVDAVMDIVVIKFWDGLKAFSLEDVLIPETFVSATNLQWRGKTNAPIQSLYAVETTYFTQRPRDQRTKTALDELEKLVTQDREFFEKASEKITQLTKDLPFGRPTPAIGTPTLGKPVSASTPVNRYRKTENSFAGNSIIIESPIMPVSSPSVTKVTEQRLNTLERYGQPPSLSNLIRVNSSSARRAFKPPLKR